MIIEDSMFCNESIKYKEIVNKYLMYYKEIYSPTEDTIKMFRRFYSVLQEISLYDQVAILPSGYHARHISEEASESLDKKLNFFDEIRVNEKIAHHTIADLNSIEDSYDKYYILNHDDKLIEKLYEKLIQKVEKNKIIRFNEIEVDESEFYNNISFNEEERNIVFVSFCFPSPLLDLVEQLRKNSIKVTLITTTHTAAFGESLINYFDNIIFTKYDDVFEIVKKVRDNYSGKIVFTGNFVADHIFAYLLKQIVKYDFYYYKYDLVDGYYGFKTETPFMNNAHYKMQDTLGKEIWEVDEYYKQRLYNEIDGFIYRDSESIFHKMRESYNPKIKNIQIYPIPKSIPIKTESVTNKQDGISVVWAGHLSLDEGSFGPQNSLFDIVPDVVSNKITFNMYNISDHYKVLNDKFLSKIKREYQDYFQYHFPIVGQEVLPTIGKYDFGFMVFDFKEFDYNMDFHRFTISTKLFTYINAELPILISEEYEEMCKVVQKYSCGIIIRNQDLAHLELEKYDYDRLKQNVRFAKEDLERMRIKSIDDFIHFVGLGDD